MFFHVDGINKSITGNISNLPISISNVKTIFDNEGNLIYKGRFTRGEDEGTFMYNTYSINPSTGEIVYDRDGEPVEIQYDFDQAVIYSDYARPIGGDYEHPGWQY